MQAKIATSDSLVRLIVEYQADISPITEEYIAKTDRPRVGSRSSYISKIIGLNQKIETSYRKKRYARTSTKPYDDKVTSTAENFWEPIISRSDKIQSDIEKNINSILAVDFDWEDSGLEKPLHQSLDFARDIIKSLIDKVFSDKELATQWISPLHIYSNEAAYICITWNCESRTLIFQIRHDVMKYRQAEVNTDVSPKKITNKTGDLNTENSLEIWKWIINGEQTNSKK